MAMDLNGVTLQKLRLFVLVYDKGSFNQAAQSLNMSQSAVSQHIQSLEQVLGTALFVRTPQGVRPTQAGDIVYNDASKMLAVLEKMGQSISNVREQAQQRLALGATPGVSVYLLPAWIKRFQENHLDITLALETILTANLVQGVMDGRYVFGVTVGALDDLIKPEVAYQVLSEIGYFVVVPANHSWAEQMTVTMEQLITAPFLNRRPTSRSRNWLETKLGGSTRLNTVAEFDTPSGIIQAVLNELGVSILPEHAIKREVERGDVVSIPLDGLQLSRPLLLLWKKNQPWSATQEAFLDALPENYAL